MTKRKIDADDKMLAREVEVCHAAAVNAMYYQETVKILNADLEAWRKNLLKTASARGKFKLAFVFGFSETDPTQHTTRVLPTDGTESWSFEKFLQSRQNTGPFVVAFSDNALDLYPPGFVKTRLEAFGFTYLICPKDYAIETPDLGRNSQWCHGRFTLFNLRSSRETEKIYSIIVDETKLHDIAVNLYNNHRAKHINSQNLKRSRIEDYETKIATLQAKLIQREEEFKLLFPEP